jgi:hypothetical protein
MDFLTCVKSVLGFQACARVYGESGHGMKITTVMTILWSSLVVVLTVSVTALLSELGEPLPDVRYEDLQAGWLLPIFCGPTLWSNLPSYPPAIAALIDVYGFAFLGVCLVSIGAVAWRRPVTSRTGAAMLTLTLGMVPSVAGAIVLRDGTASPDVVGSWASFMILSLLYSAIASVFLAISDLRKPEWLSVIRLRPGSQTAAQVQ